MEQGGDLRRKLAMLKGGAVHLIEGWQGQCPKGSHPQTQIFRLSLHQQDEQVLAVPSVLGKPGVNAHACNAIIQEAKARGSWVGDWPRLPGLKAAWDTQPATVLQKQSTLGFTNIPRE